MALITGVTGQDGSYLAELLLEKGYEVHGIKRRASQFNTDRIDHIYKDPHEEDVDFFLHYGDLTDSTNLIRIVQEKTYLGNLDAERDWGHARDYVEGMWRMLQQEEPEDYVLATGRTTTVRRFCEMAFEAAGIELVWEGAGEDEVGYDAETGEPVVEIDPRYYRPTEVHQLLGKAEKAREELGWTPSRSLEQLADEMVTRDLKEAQETVAVANHRAE